MVVGKNWPSWLKAGVLFAVFDIFFMTLYLIVHGSDYFFVILIFTQLPISLFFRDLISPLEIFILGTFNWFVIGTIIGHGFYGKKKKK